MLVSVLLPTRRRLTMCLAAVRSLLDTAADLSRVEILLRLDGDDTETAEALRQRLPPPPVVRVLFGVRHTYREMQTYLTEMCAIAQGQWLLQFNDDATMQTQRWDALFAEYETANLLLGDTNGIFMAVPRRFYEVWGHWAAVHQGDSYLCDLGRQAGILRLLALDIAHRPVRDDETGREETWEQDFTGKATPAIAEDIAKLKQAGFI